MAKPFLPKQVFGQPHVDCDALRWAGELIDFTRHAKQYASGAFCDDGLRTEQIISEVWASAYRRTPRVEGCLDTQAFRHEFVRAAIDWCAEHLAARESDGEPASAH